MPEVIDTRVICKQRNKYIGWPTVATAPDGTVHAVFSGDRDGHVCPFGKSYIMSTKDGGDTWTEPRIVNDTPMDDRDTGLCVCPDGTLVISWFTSFYYRSYEINWGGYTRDGHRYGATMLPWADWENTLKKITPDDLDKQVPFISCPTPADTEKWTNAWDEYNCESSVEYDPRFPAPTRRLGYWTRRSNDGGLTWDEPTLSPGNAPHGPNVLPDGSLIYIGNNTSWSNNLVIATSPDKGLRWKMASVLNGDVGGKDGVEARLCEPHVVAAPSGKLIGMARYQATLPGEERYLWQFDSEDGGATWSDPRPSTVNGYPPHLLRVSDGRLVASCSVRHEPYGFRFCFSDDEGETWNVDDQLFLNAGENTDLGYPATAEVEPGRFLSVYYRNDRPDEKPCLVMTRWTG